jgi:hypothetical protein
MPENSSARFSRSEVRFPRGPCPAGIGMSLRSGRGSKGKLPGKLFGCLPLGGNLSFERLIGPAASGRRAAVSGW